jgi:hypothetical protein
MMTDYLNWTIEAHVKHWDDYDDSHDDLTNGKYDMYTLTYEKTKIREKVFDFSEPLYEVSFWSVFERGKFEWKIDEDFWSFVINW